MKNLGNFIQLYPLVKPEDGDKELEEVSDEENEE